MQLSALQKEVSGSGIPQTYALSGKGIKPTFLLPNSPFLDRFSLKLIGTCGYANKQTNKFDKQICRIWRKSENAFKCNCEADPHIQTNAGWEIASLFQ